MREADIKKFTSITYVIDNGGLKSDNFMTKQVSQFLNTEKLILGTSGGLL
jgi:protein involved in ribonucleotide reduction